MESDVSTVEGLLARDVMSPDVIKVRVDDSVVAVGNLLARQRISGAVVMEDKKIAGVINKESFVTGVRYMGDNPLDSFKVKDFMLETYETAGIDESLGKIVDRISSSPSRVDRVLILEGGNLAGILTRSDITEVFSQHAKNCFKVRDLMEVNPVTVNDYTPIDKILDAVTTAQEKRVIVMAGRRVLGVVTVLDLSLGLFDVLKRHRNKDPLDVLKLGDVITLNPIMVEESVDAAEAAGLMVGNRIGGLPVYDHKLRGVITKSDIVKGFKILKDSKRLK